LRRYAGHAGSGGVKETLMRLEEFFRKFVWNLCGVFAPPLREWKCSEGDPYDDPFLEDPDMKQQEIHYLQFQLAKVRADNYETAE